MLSFGGFLNSTFWSSYRNQSSASIEDILNKKDCTVEKLLEDEDCLQEFKNLNDKLIQYFDHDKMKHLVDLITVMPPENASHNRGHKFPFLANEIFNCEINALLDRFFDGPDAAAIRKTKSAPTATSAEDSQESEKIQENAKTAEFPVSKPDEEEDSTEKPAASEETKADAVDNKEGKQHEDAEEPVKQAEETVKAEESVQAEDKKEDDEVKAENAVEAKHEVKEEDKLEDPQNDGGKSEHKEGQELMSENVEAEASEHPVPKIKEEEKKGEIATQKVGETPGEETATQKDTEVQGEEDIEIECGQYMLLDRLMRFIRTKEKNLNAVLSGYFAKLLTLLLTRKQKNLLPYIFQEGSYFIECLLNHVYQKSISELISKLLNISEDSVKLGNAGLVGEVKKSQRYILNTLIDKLGPVDMTEEDNLNASSILQDALDTKEYYSVVSHRSNILKLLEFAIPNPDHDQQNFDSQNSALGVLTQIVSLYPERKKDDKKKQAEEEDEDSTLQSTAAHNSEEEDENSESSMISILARNIPRVVSYLQAQTHQASSELETSYDAKIVPLGSLRLKLIEFVYHLMKLGNENILTALAQTNFFEQLSHLLEKYSWNNFLQLKAISIFDEILDNSNTEFRIQALTSSKICETLIAMANKNKFDHTSSRTIRHGYMAVTVKLANQINAKAKDWASDYFESLGEDWRLFNEGELKRSNETNSKSLGGQQPRPSGSDDDEMEGSMSMDSILSRFSNFNTEMGKRHSLNSNDDDDDDDDEDEEDNAANHHTQEEEKDSIMKERDQQYEKENSKEVAGVVAVVNQEEHLVKDFVDSNYWKVDLFPTQSIDDLLAEMEN